MTAAKASTTRTTKAAAAPAEPAPSDEVGQAPVQLPEDPQLRALALLRVPFPAASISLLPKQMKRDDSNKGPCEDTPRGRGFSGDGKFCGGWHARSIHLDYVGHAALTHRLLEVDPLWNWEPLAFDEQGLPRFDRNGNLWIRLTVAGMTRLGFGDAPGKRDATKEVIGDALRNAGMRFGMALDLWHKGDLFDAKEEQGTEQNPASAAPAAPPASPRATPAAPEPPAGAEQPSRAASAPTRAPFDEDTRSAWRRRVLSTAYLGGDPAKGAPRDGGLRWAFRDAKENGILPELAGTTGDETFAALLQRLSRELPERADESGDEIPGDEPLDDGAWSTGGSGWGTPPAAGGAHTR